jgi:hypothetical protein
MNNNDSRKRGSVNNDNILAKEIESYRSKFEYAFIEVFYLNKG